MTNLSIGIIFHLFKWQLRQQRILIPLNAAIIILFLLAQSLHQPGDMWDAILVIGIWFLGIGVALLIDRLAHSQPFTGTESFWMTRPFNRQSLVYSQVLLIIVFVALPVLLGMCWHTFQLDGNGVHYLMDLCVWGMLISGLLYIYAISIVTPHFIGSAILLILSQIIMWVPLSLINPYASDDILIILYPIFGLITIFSLIAFCKRITRVRYVILTLAALVPIFVVQFEEIYLKDLLSNKTVEVEIRPFPDTEQVFTHASYYFPIQFTNLPNDAIAQPQYFNINTQKKISYSGRFSERNLHGIFADRIITLFPEAKEVVSLAPIPKERYRTDLRAGSQKELTSVEQFTLKEPTKFQSQINFYSYRHVGGLPLKKGATWIQNGLKARVKEVKKITSETIVTLEFTGKMDVASINEDFRYLSGEVPLLYDTQAQRIIILNAGELHSNTYWRHPLNLNASTFVSTCRIPNDLINQDTELHSLLYSYGSSTIVNGIAQAGHYVMP
ncbi:MAG: hypothetical protein AAGH40_05275 [Verrucomicrobiota bacterium]